MPNIGSNARLTFNRRSCSKRATVSYTPKLCATKRDREEGPEKEGSLHYIKREAGRPACTGSLSCHAHQTAPRSTKLMFGVPQGRAQPWYSAGSAPKPRRGTEGSTPSQLRNWKARLPDAPQAELQYPGGRHQMHESAGLFQPAQTLECTPTEKSHMPIVVKSMQH